jgi:hypothetical protein
VSDQSDSVVLLRNDTVIVTSGETVGGIKLATNVGPVAVNDSGEYIFGALVYYPGPQFQQSALFRSSKKVAVPGEVIDGLTIQNAGAFAINDPGKIVFGAEYTSTNSSANAIFKPHHVFIKAGDTVGGYLLTRVDPNNVGLGNGGLVAFRGASSATEGIFTQNGAVVKTGDTIGGLTITGFHGIEAPSFSMSEAGEIAFSANPGGAAFVAAHNVVLAKAGDPIPENPIPNGHLVSFDTPSINYYGDVVFTAHGGQPFNAPMYGVLLKNKTLILGYGDTILGHPSGGGPGSAVINDAGQIAFLCNFADIGVALVVATPK